ncbi:MAG: helix-turn-helix domain-containing protein [Bacteroidales bacterium]|nr:helix-turn-helix domain-containing protein [Bacteroidales bacterium]HPE86043.1 helix-turn-helix domain-containing protein [Bacteroidales bacterium]
MTNKTISFENMPSALQELRQEIRALREMISSSPNSKTQDEYFDIQGLINYLPSHPSRSTVYGWTCNRTIPFIKQGKRVVFKRSDIDEWLNENKKRSFNRTMIKNNLDY